MPFSSRYFVLVVCSWVLCLWLLGRCEVLTSNMVEDSSPLSMWRCIVFVRISGQFDGLEMKALQSLEMMGTAHSLMSQHHILQDLNLLCFVHCASLYIYTSLLVVVNSTSFFYTISSHLRMLKLSCIYFGVPTAVSLRIQVYGHLMLCCWISVSGCFDGTLPFAWTHQTLKLQALLYFEMPRSTNLVTLCHIPDSLNPLHLNYSQMLSRSLIY